MTTEPGTQHTAAIMSDPEYSRAAMVERRRWRIAFSRYPDRRKFVTSKREAIEWCEEMGLSYVISAPVRPRGEVG